MPNWTKQQEQAIRARNHTILVSAAAGSGKTAVLVERIVSLVREGASMNRMLIVTFTKTAAAEMRQRLAKRISREAISREPAMVKALDELETTQISTIHAFCQRVIRSHFEQVGVDPLVRVCDEQQQKLLFEAAFTTAMDELLDERTDENFLLLADAWKQDKLLSLTARLYDFLMALPKPFAWLDEHVDQLSQPLMQQPWVETLENAAKLQVGAMDDALIAIRSLFDMPNAVMDRMEALNADAQLISALQGLEGEALRMAVANFSLPRLSPKRGLSAEEKEWGKRFSDGRTAIKKRAERANELLNPDFAQLERELPAIQAQLRGLAALVKRTHQHFREEKNVRNCMDFGDMEQYTLDILEQPEVRAQMQGEFDHIFVDECQDVSQVQDAILQAIHGEQNCLFMVGDVKQSIYGFRLADPSIFLEKYHTYSLDKDAPSHRIDLNRNFRSDAAILSSINFIFRQIMTAKSLELDYGNAEALYAGRHEEERPLSYVGGSVSIDLIDREGLKDAEVSEDVRDMENIALEGRLIARRIHEIMDGGMVMEKNGTFRPIKYGDIVILLRSIAGKGPQLMKVLEENHIPAVSDKEEDFMENSEVEVLWALLKILDNPRQDLALAAVLRSFFAGLDEKDLSLLYLEKVRQGETNLWPVLTSSVLSKEKEEKLQRFLHHYRDWWENGMQDGTAPLLRRILGDTDYLTYVSGLSGGAWRAGHILSFYHLALERDSAPQSGLYSFLNYLSKLKKEKKSFKALAVSAMPDSVHIMTIHKSKGLEFPVVFLADARKEFNLRDTWQTAICHKDLGLGIQYYDKKNRVRWPSLYWYALREASRRENLAEEARLLYVAMTRARDKLFVTAVLKDAASDLDRWTTSLSSAGSGEALSPLPAHLTANAKSFLDWIMPAALQHRTMKDAWERAGKIPSYRDDAPRDHSCFSFSITSQMDLLTEDEKEASPINGKESLLPSTKEENREEKTELSHFLAHLPDQAPDWMDAQLSWTYRWQGALETPAKLTATAAVHLRELAEYAASDEPPQPSVILADEGDSLDADYAAPPLFLSGDETKYQGTSFGTLMHKAMEMIDFTTLPADAESLEAALHQLVEEKVFTEEEGKILLSQKRKPSPLSSLLAFARGPLAEKMKTASHIRKEMPFSILLPARSFYPKCEEGENIFLQGVMDCLLEYEKDFIIIDYKTDRTMTEEELKEHYKIQLQVYGEAAEKLLGKPVSHLYLWSFTYGKAIEVEKM